MRRQFHPSCVPVSADEWTWPTFAQSIQYHVATKNAHDGGLCGFLTILVMLICIRFNYYNPKDVADMITPYLNKDKLINKLIYWYGDLIKTFGNQDKFIEKIMPLSTEYVCRVFNPSTRRLCRRNSCANGPAKCMCWQHRALVMNNKAKHKRCGTEQVACS